MFSLRILLLVSSWIALVNSHGRLMEPPSRSSMWRKNFNTPRNYNDNELFCGGFNHQWAKNGGKCGICGDPWDQPEPRDNEDGGKYGLGIVTRTYKLGQVIVVTVDITAHHKGYFEFRLCPVQPGKKVDQECLDRNLLKLPELGGATKYYLLPGTTVGIYNIKAKLPHNLVCDRCVFQWHYYTGNNWGTCKNGTSSVGCGPQETFRGCSDIAIKP